MSDKEVAESDPSVEMEASSHPDGKESEQSENNPMEVDDSVQERPKTLANLEEPKDSSPSKLNIKVLSPTNSPVKDTSSSKGKRQSPGKPSENVPSPSKGKRLSPSKPSENVSPIKIIRQSPSKSSENVSLIKGKRQSPSKHLENVPSPSKKPAMEVKTTEESVTDRSTLQASGWGEIREEHMSFATDEAPGREEENESGVSTAPPDPSHHSHVCVGRCIHGGARPKTRALGTAHQSYGVPESFNPQNERSQILKQMNRFAERMERNFSRNPAYFGNVSRQEWTRKVENNNFFAEELACDMGHGHFAQTPLNTSSHLPPMPSLVQLNRMFTGLSLERRNNSETGTPEQTPQRMDPEQERRKFHEPVVQEPTIDVDNVPESKRPMEVDEVLTTSFPNWHIPADEPAPDNQTSNQESPKEQAKDVEQPLEEEPTRPTQEYRLIRLYPMVPPMGSFVINPSHPYRHRDENVWRAAMMAAYRSERYHSNQMLHDTMSQLEREGISQEDFFRFYHSARRIDLFRDEGMEDERTESEREEITIEDKINRVIIAVGFMTVAMLYIRLYISRHPEIESSSESSTMDSGNVDHSESEPQVDYTRLREHVNLELDNSTNSPKGVDSPGDNNNSPQSIQSPDFVPIPNRGSPVNVLMPLSQVPKRSDTPSSQGSLLVDNDRSSSSSSKKGVTLRRAVLGKCHSQSLDDTSGDASPILFDEEDTSNKKWTFGQLMNLMVYAIYVVSKEIKSWEEEDREQLSKDKEETDSGTAGLEQCPSEMVTYPSGDMQVDQEDQTDANLESRLQSSKDEVEGDYKEKTEEKMDQLVECASENEKEGETSAKDDDSASRSNVNGRDGSETGDVSDDLSKSGQSKKRKDHSDSDDELDRLSKRGKEG